ncbi:Hypothetical protein NTJ_00288 [Nesidiocoris tenuis]|uniref:Uncharacterized protein n=1 Tax=Nesidiocoris tenuis TaxID=355587 RepID=A0ABN7A6E5_9HEMI|nr:Hypothetical protein NTJ_00288 [Nesidiocoris tenuis]
MKFGSPDSCGSTEIIADSQGESPAKGKSLDNSQNSQLVISIQTDSDVNISLQNNLISPNSSAVGSSLCITISPGIMTKTDAEAPGPSGMQPRDSEKPSSSLDSPSRTASLVPVQYGTPPKATSSKHDRSRKRSASWSSVESPRSKRGKAPAQVSSPGPSAELEIRDFTPDKGSTPKCQSPRTPSRDPLLNLLQSEDPSPYKSFRPKYLPKNCKQHRKKYEERQKYLESVREIEKKWEKRAPADLMPSWTPEHEPVNVDPCGHTIPQLRYFRPEKYFISFTEQSLNVNDFVPPDSPLLSKSCRAIFLYLQSVANYTPTASECRFFFYWLSVTRKSHVVGFVVPFFHQRLLDRHLYLGWPDVQKILVNFGLTKEPPQLVGAVGSRDSRTGPQPWNLEFFVYLLENSYPNYSCSKLSRMLTFLAGVLFEPLFSPLKSRVAALANKIIALLIAKRIDEKALLDCVDQDFFSICCNRYLFQMMSSDPTLREISQSFAVKIIEGALNNNSDLQIKVSCSRIMDTLVKNRENFEKLDLICLFQVIMIVEKLLLMETSESVRTDGVRRLSTLLQSVGQTRNHFERLYLDEIIRRVKVIDS